MNREQAIEKATEARRGSTCTYVEDVPGGYGQARAMVNDNIAIVDTLVALGVLKLDDGASELPPPTYLKPAEPPRCEPPPEHHEKLYHWLRSPGLQMIIRQWSSVWTSFTGEQRTSEEMAKTGWRYVAPCEEPKEAATPQPTAPTFHEHQMIWVTKDDDEPTLVGRKGRVITTDIDGWYHVQLERVIGYRRYRPEHLSAEAPKP